MKKSEQADFLKYIKIGIVIIDRETHLIQYVNEDAALMADSTPDEMTGNRCFGFICTADEGICPFEGNAEISPSVSSLVRSDGSALDIIKTIRPTSLRGVPCYVETFFELDDIRRFGDLINREQERLDRAMTIGRQGIWEYNRETKELYFDEHFYRMAGYGDGDFPADFDSWLTLVHEDDREGTAGELDAFVSGKTDSYNCSFMFRRKSGRYMWIRARGEKVTRIDGSGSSRLLCIHLDISQDKEREKRNLLRNSLQMRLLKPAPLQEKSELICKTVRLATSTDTAELWVKGYFLGSEASPEKPLSLHRAAFSGKTGEDSFGAISLSFIEKVMASENAGPLKADDEASLTGFQLKGSDGNAIGALVLSSPGDLDSEKTAYLESLASITSQVILNNHSEENLITALSDMERAVNLMNGREARILEIKEEVNQLLSQSGKSAKYDLDRKPDQSFTGQLTLREEKRIALSLAEDAEITRRQLVESNEQLLLIKAAVNSSSDGVAISTTSGMFYFINQTFTSLLGYSVGDLMITPEEKIFSRPEDYTSCLKTTLNGGSFLQESFLKTKGGKILPAFLRASAFNDKEGYPIGIIWNITDITLRKENEKKINSDLAAQKEMLRKALVLQQNYIQRSIPVIRNFNIQGLFMPCEKLGGDFFKILRGISEDKLIIVMGDCTDHGLKASLDASLLSSVTDHHIEQLFRSGRTDLFLKSISRSFMDMADEDQFPTMTVLLIDLTKGILRYSNANGELPYLIRDGRAVRLDPVQGMHISYFADPVYGMNEMELLSEDRLLIYSDAVVEMKDSRGRRNSRAIFESLLEKSRGNSSRYFYSLIRELEKLNGSYPLDDDTTLIQLEYRQPKRFNFSFHHIDEWDRHLTAMKKLMHNYDFGIDETEKTAIAITELAINAFVHGNRSDSSLQVMVRGAIDCGSIVVTLADRGEGFKREDIIDPVTNIQEIMDRDVEHEYTHGRGLKIADDFLSEIIRNKKGNEVTAIQEKKKRDIITIDKISF
ncbi:SpoIIE family protein phosphatase [Spirochaeta isovalerica]|uniref:PAS domain S-box-containing protein n=1 Tax=Spirochaeta isovalerica TaxID=150 RepID=A0A841R8H1_9SPIO|nr:SpoIIE family protein phosphatase [Spirochaeta isovalerica]MBB6480195.1 PAS domain S-box-containing protein [Spirochaeta isovalerica]